MDKDGTGSIDLPEFLQMMRIKFEEEVAEEEIRTAFQVFDGVSNTFLDEMRLILVHYRMAMDSSTDMSWQS